MSIILGPLSHLPDGTFELIFKRWNLSNPACTVSLYNKYQCQLMFLRDFTLRFTVMVFNVTCKKTVKKKIM